MPKQTLATAIAQANALGFPYAVQEWCSFDGSPSDYVVAHGSADGIGKTVYATIKLPVETCDCGCGSAQQHQSYSDDVWSY